MARLRQPYPWHMASLSIAIDSNLDKATSWAGAMNKQMRFAASQALNASAKGSRSIAGSDTYNALTALQGASRGYFDKPTPFIQKAWRATTANKSNLELTIYPEDKRLKYLKAHITGGDRTYKAYEAKILGLTKQGTQVLIPSFVKLNNAGNVSRATLGKIITAATTQGAGSVLVGTPRGGNRPLGVYERTRGASLKPLFVAQQKANYRPGFPLIQTVETVFGRRYTGYFQTALEQALASAR